LQRAFLIATAYLIATAFSIDKFTAS